MKEALPLLSTSYDLGYSKDQKDTFADQQFSATAEG